MSKFSFLEMVDLVRTKALKTEDIDEAITVLFTEHDAVVDDAMLKASAESKLFFLEVCSDF